MIEKCFAWACFTALRPDGQKFFGFSEFLAGLALMILAWTIADVRYRFRIQSAPIPLQRITFFVVAVVGVLALLTDLWRAQGWLVPRGGLITPAVWQALLAGLFFLTFLTWAWFAFIRPPIFGKWNARQYTRALYQSVLRGAPAELAVIADEIARSARALVRHSVDRDEQRVYQLNGERGQLPSMPTKVRAYASDILLLIADKRFCRAIVSSAPVAAFAIFKEVSETKRYTIQVGPLARNIMNEALSNKDSFLFHETEGYESGLIGHIKPLSQAMFSNYQMVEAVGTMLDPEVLRRSDFDADKLNAYCQVVLLTLEDYVDRAFDKHSFALLTAQENIRNSVFDLYKLDGLNITWETDAVSRLRVVMEFVRDAVGLINEKGVCGNIILRTREGRESFFDSLALVIFEVISNASAIRSPQEACWTIQFGLIWSKLTMSHGFDNSAGRIVMFKLRRLIYNEISGMRRWPGKSGARILGFCLNVMGLRLGNDKSDGCYRALHKVVLFWMKRNYAWLHGYDKQIAEYCLVDGLAFDPDNLRIVKTYPAGILRREAEYIYLDVSPFAA